MSTIAEIELPREEFSLRSSLSSGPEAEFEIVRVAAHDESDVVPYVRVTGPNLDDLHDAILDDDTVADAVLLDDLDDERLYRMRWATQAKVVAHVLTERDGTILDMYGSGDRWHLRILFPGRDALSATNRFCDDQGLTFNIKRIHELNASVGRSEFGLTRDQYEVLVAAAESGYFGVPRELTMGELAAEMGISQQALSERLRRGHKALIDSALRIDGTTFDRTD